MRSLFCLSVTGCLIVPASAQSLLDPRLRIDTVVTGLAQPTALACLAEGEFLVCEKASGQVRHVIDGVIQTAPAIDLAVNSAGERGLLGIALDPAFPATPHVYLYYSVSISGEDSGESPGWPENRASRFVWDGAALLQETILMRFARDTEQNNPSRHHGGVIQFGPDGTLYIATGDLDRNRAEQNNLTMPDLSSHVGGIYRINSDGAIPEDNPFIGHANPDFHGLFAYGVRNCFGLAFDSQTGLLWDTENGSATYDEINLVRPGLNSGWNKIMGPDSRDPQGVGDLVMFANAEYSDPEFSFLQTIAITSILFVNGGGVPAALADKVLIGDANFGNLYVFSLNTSRDAFELSGDLADLVADNPIQANSLRIGIGLGITTDLDLGASGEIFVTSLTDGVVRRIRAACMGDLNGSGSVGLGDLTILLANFGTESGATWAQGDLDGNQAVGLSDLTLLLANFGNLCD